MGVEPTTMSDVCAKVGKRTHVGWYRTAPLRTGKLPEPAVGLGSEVPKTCISRFYAKLQDLRRLRSENR